MQQVVGVTGPSNHGKTSLLRALLGAEKFELLTEESMESTTDIGYSELKLPVSGNVTVVDLPGHNRFQTNMIAGALGVDLAVFVVAADESESVDITDAIKLLEFLPIKQLIFAVTRIDSAKSIDLDEIQAAIIDALYTTRFINAKVAFVSAITGHGLDELKEAIDHELQEFKEPLKDRAGWYMPVDRVIPLTGREIVAIGVIAEGVVKVGEEAQIVPNMDTCRILGIRYFNQAATSAQRGQRVAITISGSNLHLVGRGSNIGSPGYMTETALLDVKLEYLKPNDLITEVHLSIGANDVVGRLYKDQKDSSRAQLRLSKTVGAKELQPVILRHNSNKKLLASGFVLHAEGETRIKRDAPVGDAEAMLFELVANSPSGILTNDICNKLRKTQQELGDVFEKLITEQKIISFAGLWMTPISFLTEAQKFLLALQELHEAFPTKIFQPREAVVAKMESNWSAKPLDRIVQKLADLGKIEMHNNGIRLKGFKITLSAKQDSFLTRVEEELNQHGLEIPYASQIAKRLGVPVRAVEEIMTLGYNAGRLVMTAETLYYTQIQIETFKSMLKDHFKDEAFGVTEMRDLFGTSRRFLIPILEYFDKVGFTQRNDDERKIIG
ncbi:MAG: SelB C-terminal domain-containing protein [Fimbriimonadaceae bacterium]|nr:SelB C-terminal domain-containing protein [Fimbriimonadaceae bacterium]